MRADGRRHLSSALHRLVAVTHAVLCQRDLALILLVFLSLREAGSEWLLSLHRNTRRQGRVLGTSHPPLTLLGAAVGLPLGQQEEPTRNTALSWDALQLQWLSQGLSFQWSISCQRWVSLDLCKEHLLQQ